MLQAPPAPSAGSKLTTTGASNTSVMLAMTDNQAQKVQYVLANAADTGAARWHLELRPVTHAADSGDHIDSFGSVVSDGLSARQRHALGR